MRAFVLALGMLLAGSAVAQLVTLTPSAAERCLVPLAEQRGLPEYPPDELSFGSSGRVKVELEFSTSDDAPAVKVLEREGSDLFVEAVEKHVRGFRVPCLASAEGPSRLVIDFRFKPDDRTITWSEPLDPWVPVRQRQLDCVKHISGDKAPEYPFWARRAERQGRVVARMRFDGPDRPPVVEVFARPAMRELAKHVQQWAEGYRMPCHGGAPVSAETEFIFRMEDTVYGFKAITLLDFMAMVRGIDKQRLEFDFYTMACPFAVKLRYTQPLLPNRVGELNGQDPERRPFLRWLSGAELDLEGRALDAVFGAHVTLTIPCIKINLNPQGETQ